MAPSTPPPATRGHCPLWRNPQRRRIRVCRASGPAGHRSSRDNGTATGTASRLRCHYHGWTYDLQGRLRGTPEFDGVEDFAKEDNGLASLAVECWGPYVLVNGASGALRLAEFLAPLPDRSRAIGLDRLRFVERREYNIECNWKVFIDNFQDGG